MKKEKILSTILGLLLLVSLFFNAKPEKAADMFIHFPNANTRPTYDSFHNIKQAHTLATGKGIKIGIIDKYFGYERNGYLYAGGMNFTGDHSAFNEIAEHGLWMSKTLKEIAPDAQIYALNARENDVKKESEAIVSAILWAIDNELDILTYSARAFSPENISIIDSAVRKAIENGIVTTFIHYDLDENILPIGFFSSSPDRYSRAYDINIFHYDYNLLFLPNYKEFAESGAHLKNNGNDPYFSYSSMSVVLAGIVALMKEKNNSLKPDDYKRILRETSYSLEFWSEKVAFVANAFAAVSQVTVESNIMAIPCDH